MEDMKAFLHKLIDGISNEGTLEYLVTFLTLYLQKLGK